MNLHDNWDRDFDRSFARAQKRTETFFKFSIAAWIAFVLVDLAILAGIVYVILHFLAKVW